MKMNMRILVLASAILAAAFIAHSSATDIEKEDEERQLSSVLTALGPILGLFAGLALARSFGGFGRGRRRCGRSLEDNNPLEKIRQDLMNDAMEVMMETNEEQCFERMFCDIAARDKKFDCDHFKDLLEFIKDGDSYVQMEYAEFYGKLKESDQTGENSGDAAVCETRYECPLTGEEMAEMMKSQFEGDDE